MGKLGWCYANNTVRADREPVAVFRYGFLALLDSERYIPDLGLEKFLSDYIGMILWKGLV